MTGTLLSAAIVAAGLAYALAAHLGYRMLPVLSGSMEPALPVGTLAVVKPIPAAEAQEGDVVTFRNPQGDFLTTHRIVAKRREGADLAFRTQGDAVGEPDPWTLRTRDGRGTFGRVEADVPFAGFVLVHLQRPVTAVVLVWAAVLVAAALVLHVLWRRPASPRRRPAA